MYFHRGGPPVCGGRVFSPGRLRLWGVAVAVGVSPARLGAPVHGVAKSRTRLSGFTFTVHFHALETEMATHSSVLAWRIPGPGEPGVYGVAQSWTRLKRLSSSSSRINTERLLVVAPTSNNLNAQP